MSGNENVLPDEHGLIDGVKTGYTRNQVLRGKGHWYAAIIASKYHYSKGTDESFCIYGSINNTPTSTDIKNREQWDKSWLVYHIVGCDTNGRLGLVIDTKVDVEHLYLIFEESQTADKPEWAMESDKIDRNAFLSGIPPRGIVVPGYMKKIAPKFEDSLSNYKMKKAIKPSGGFKGNPIPSIVRAINKQVEHSMIYKRGGSDKKKYDRDTLIDLSSAIGVSIVYNSQNWFMRQVSSDVY